MGASSEPVATPRDDFPNPGAVFLMNRGGLLSGAVTFALVD